jgi:hypothetical protein
MASVASEDARILPSLLAYGASILSFLGGIQWGVALNERDDERRSPWVMGISIFPSLIAWSALLQPNVTWGIGIVMAGLLSALVVDGYLVRMGMVANWFWSLRRWITAAAFSFLAIALLMH